jgi:hypothetical protein
MKFIKDIEQKKQMKSYQSTKFGCIIVVFAIIAFSSTKMVSFAIIDSNSSITDSTKDFVLPSGSSTHFPVGPTLEHKSDNQTSPQKVNLEITNSHPTGALQSPDIYVVPYIHGKPIH